ncbi:type 1 glutamine amidotransferase [Leuconostocaceae bacterium ESL0723]|nr:type 1 glutamine amidotransferase [Leuconostocaceae bacterium ESL0723]
MRINVLQHTPNEGPGAIQTWADQRGHEVFIYHPYQFGKLPSADETDFLVVLGGPMGPNDDLPWIKAERDLIKTLLDQGKSIYGACFGAQQIAKTLGAKIGKAPVKEVGWAPVYRETDAIPGLPEKALALHWHEETFDLPAGSQLLFSSDLLKNQGFVIGHQAIGLQFHLEPQATNLREMVVNDGQYALDHNDLHQGPADILDQPVPAENPAIMFTLLDYLAQ